MRKDEEYLIKILESYERELEQWMKEMQEIFNKVEHRYKDISLLRRNLKNKEASNG